MCGDDAGQPVGRRHRSAADPGDGRAACGTARAARKSRRESWRDSQRFLGGRCSPRAPRARPAVIGEVLSRRAKSGAGGSRAKLRECGPLTEATLSSPASRQSVGSVRGGFAGDLGGERGEFARDDARKILAGTSMRTRGRVTREGGNRVRMGCTWRVGSGELLVYLAGGFVEIAVYLAGGFLRVYSREAALLLGSDKPLVGFSEAN